MALELESKEAPAGRLAEGADNGRQIWRVGSVPAFACFALLAGAAAYLASHLLTPQLRGAVGGMLTALSGLVWAASAVDSPRSQVTSGLGVGAAWLAYLAGLCILP